MRAALGENHYFHTSHTLSQDESDGAMGPVVYPTPEWAGFVKEVCSMYNGLTICFLAHSEPKPAGAGGGGGGPVGSYRGGRGGVATCLTLSETVAVATMPRTW